MTLSVKYMSMWNPTQGSLNDIWVLQGLAKKNWTNDPDDRFIWNVYIAIQKDVVNFREFQLCALCQVRDVLFKAVAIRQNNISIMYLFTLS